MVVCGELRGVGGVGGVVLVGGGCCEGWWEQGIVAGGLIGVAGFNW